MGKAQPSLPRLHISWRRLLFFLCRFPTQVPPKRKSAYQHDRVSFANRSPGGAHPVTELSTDPELPPGTFMITIGVAQEMPADAVARLGRAHAADIDWVAIANHIGFPDLATTLRDVFLNTRWRRFSCKGRFGVTQFTANRAEGRGTVGPLGAHLVHAAINLVAAGDHTIVQRLEAHPGG